MIKYFPVPKGENNIRTVYDGTDIGFNSMVMVPSFGLPAIDTLKRGTDPNTWMVDLDIGEHFLNFCLYPDAVQYIGVDLIPIYNEDIKKKSSKLI